MLLLVAVFAAGAILGSALHSTRQPRAISSHKLARANVHAAQRRMAQRLYTFYVNAKPSTLDVLAGASSLSQVIDRTEAAQALSQQDAVTR
jgi:uncharacterized membrane protein